jgi:Domain of unknown function (DU1801)
MNNLVEQKFQSYPDNIRQKMLSLRKLIYEVAKITDGVGELEETLKWGEPSYLTSKTKSGTTIRIDWKPKNPNQYVMYVNCKTSLVARFKTIFSSKFKYKDNRAIVFPINEVLPKAELRICIAMALRYHIDKSK